MITETGLLVELNLSAHSGCNRIIGVPLVWDGTGGRKSLKVNKAACFGASLQFALHAVPLFLSILYKLLNQREGGEKLDAGERVVLVIEILMAPANLLVWTYTFILYKHSDVVQSLFVEMARFEERHISLEPLSWRKVLRRRGCTLLAMPTCKLARIVTNVVTPPIVAVASVLMPSFPINLYRLYPLGRLLGWGVDSIGLEGNWGWALEKVVTFTWTLFQFQLMAKYWPILITHVVAGCVLLSNGLLTIERKLQMGRLDWDGFVGAHRELTLLSSAMNKTVSFILVLFLFMSLVLQLVSSFLLMGMKQMAVDTILFMICILALSQGVIGINLVFGFCADVHHTGKGFTKRMSGMVGRMAGGFQARKCRRMMSSLNPIRINFGGMNFIEKLTPVVFQEFATERLIDCLLLTKK